MLKQIKRDSTFETNSSSIHCLTVLKDSNIDKTIFENEGGIYPFEKDEICEPEEFCTFISKLRYLWTLRCKGSEWNVDNEKIDEFTSMLKAMFPKMHFYEIEDVAYMEDFEYGFEYDLMFDENFIRKWLSDGTGYFVSRDYNYNTSMGDYVRKVRSYKSDNIRETICWEG